MRVHTDDVIVTRIVEGESMAIRISLDEHDVRSRVIELVRTLGYGQIPAIEAMEAPAILARVQRLLSLTFDAETTEVPGRDGPPVPLVSSRAWPNECWDCVNLAADGVYCDACRQAHDKADEVTSRAEQRREDRRECERTWGA